MSARRADIFAGLDALVHEPLAFRDAHSSDRRLLVVGGKVACHRYRGDLFAEEAEAQGVHGAPLIHPGHRVQTVLAEYIEIRHGVRIERLIRERQLDYIPA